MKRFFLKIGRFFWPWLFLKIVVWTVTLVVFFYVEEDWRGARDWAATKTGWEAKGESFDFRKFIPPPVPDDRNLLALPLFKLEQVEEPYSPGKFYLQSVALRRALRTDSHDSELPSRGNWMLGELPDRAKIAAGIAADYATVFKGATPPGDTLAQFEALYPFIPDLVAASATRPLARLNLDYAIIPPAARPLGPLTIFIELSKVLTLHAVLELDHQRPDLALEDLRLNFKLLSAARHDPSIVGGLVAIGIAAISNGALYDGLALHTWSDPQLKEIDHLLASIDFLADLQFDYKCEAAVFVAAVDFYKNSDLKVIMKALGNSDTTILWPYDLMPTPWPAGWWDLNKGPMTKSVLQTVTAVDPRTHRAFPEVCYAMDRQGQVDASRWDAQAPWRIWFTLGANSSGAAIPKYASGQAWIDEARLACALERYRLAHGIYPEGRAALAPDYIDAVPHDLIGGGPYHYRLRPDGSFLLYSIGFNQKDDDGKVGLDRGVPQRIDYQQGDWVWPTPKYRDEKSK